MGSQWKMRVGSGDRKHRDLSGKMSTGLLKLIHQCPFAPKACIPGDIEAGLNAESWYILRGGNLDLFTYKWVNSDHVFLSLMSQTGKKNPAKNTSQNSLNVDKCINAKSFY